MSLRSFAQSSMALLALGAFAPSVSAVEPSIESLETLQRKILDKLFNGNPSPKEIRAMVDEMNEMMLKVFPDMQPFELPQFAALRQPGQRPAVLNRQPQPPAPPMAPEVLNRQPQPPAPPMPPPQPLPQPQLPQLQPVPAPFQPPLFPPQRPGRFRPRPQFPQDVEPLPPRPPVDPALKEFDDAIERLKDNPEAQSELKKARDEYQKALEEGLRKAEQNGEKLREPPVAVPPNLQRAEIGAGAINPAFPRDRGLELQFPQANAFRVLNPARLGVIIEKATEAIQEQLSLPATVGIVIVEVMPGSPAEKVGLRANDVIVSLAGKPAPNDLNQFQRLLFSLKDAEKHEIEIYRKGKKETLKGLEFAAPPVRGER